MSGFPTRTPPSSHDTGGGRDRYGRAGPGLAASRAGVSAGAARAGVGADARASLGLAATAEFVSSGGSLSPAPVAGLGATMRIYFGFMGPTAAESARSSNEFKGWRYPFGRPLK